MNTSLALIQPSELQLIMELADIAAMSGYAGRTKKEAAFIMLKGAELGIAPFAALDGINIIQGKPVVSPQLMIGLINRSGLLEDIIVTDDGDTCSVIMKRKGRTAHTETFSVKDAEMMGLSGKDNWKKQPRNMRKNRAIAACARVVFPDVIRGLHAVDDFVTDVESTKFDPPLKVVPSVASTPQTPTEHIIKNAEERAPKTELWLKDGVRRPTGWKPEPELEIIEGSVSEPEPQAEPEVQPEKKRREAKLKSLTRIETVANNGKKYVFMTAGGNSVSCFGRKLFREAQYDVEWWAAGEEFNPMIDVTVEENVTESGTFYTVVEVVENPFTQKVAS